MVGVCVWSLQNGIICVANEKEVTGFDEKLKTKSSDIKWSHRQEGKKGCLMKCACIDCLRELSVF